MNPCRAAIATGSRILTTTDIQAAGPAPRHTIPPPLPSTSNSPSTAAAASSYSRPKTRWPHGTAPTKGTLAHKPTTSGSRPTRQKKAPVYRRYKRALCCCTNHDSLLPLRNGETHIVTSPRRILSCWRMSLICALLLRCCGRTSNRLATKVSKFGVFDPCAG